MSFTTKQPDEVHGIGNATQARISLAAHFVMNAVADSSLFLLSESQQHQSARTLMCVAKLYIESRDMLMCC